MADTAEKDTPKIEEAPAPKPALVAVKLPIPAIGGAVHFVLDGEAASLGTHRPARILAADGDVLELVIFTKASDGARYARNVAERSDVAHDEKTKAPGTWHWPE